MVVGVASSMVIRDYEGCLHIHQTKKQRVNNSEAGP